MTPKEAIEGLKPYIDNEAYTEHFQDVCKMAITALEKQIPKKPYILQDDRNNDCIECPFCDSFIGYEYDCRDEHYQINYCPYCGQAIAWSEVE